MTQFALVIRPVPDAGQRELMQRGKDRKGLWKYGPSRAWWDRGALVVDDAGPAVVDADGLRVPVPVPPSGGGIVRFTSGGGGTNYGPAAVRHNFYVCDADRRKVALLPADGFATSDFERLAAVLGWAFESRSTDVKNDPGLSPGFVNLRFCVNTAEDRAEITRPGPLRRALHRDRQEEFSAYPEGYPRPPMDPAYLSATPGAG